MMLGVALAAVLFWTGCAAGAQDRPGGASRVIALPAPVTSGRLSLEESIAERRSVRTYVDNTLTEGEISQLLWATQGQTDPQGYRAAPSAGALYPLEVYLVTHQGVFRYLPDKHALAQLDRADRREALWQAGLKQDSLLKAPAVFVIAGVYERTASKYGERAERYVHLETGHAAQNLLLQAVALRLGAVPIGAFDDGQVQSALSLPDDHAPLYLIPVGRPAEVP